MPPAPLGDADRISEYVSRIFFLVRCAITNSAGSIGAPFLLAYYKILYMYLFGAHRLMTYILYVLDGLRKYVEEKTTEE
jgi:hypothetical protein